MVHFMHFVAETAIYFALVVQAQVLAAYFVARRCAITTGIAAAMTVAVAAAAFPCFRTAAFLFAARAFLFRAARFFFRATALGRFPLAAFVTRHHAGGDK